MLQSVVPGPSRRPATLSAADAIALLDATARLKTSALRPGWQPLRGRHLALLCGGGTADAAARFERTMAELGARVALLSARTWADAAVSELPHAARMLGSLYSAIDCCDVPAEVVEAIARHAGVPVFDALAQTGRPLGGIAELLTMREAAARPLTGLRVRLRGDPGTHAARDMLALLLGTGVAVDGDADFEFDPAEAALDGRLVVIGAGLPDQERLNAALADNRRRVQQAYLIGALADGARPAPAPAGDAN